MAHKQLDAYLQKTGSYNFEYYRRNFWESQLQDNIGLRNISRYLQKHWGSIESIALLAHFAWTQSQYESVQYFMSLVITRVEHSLSPYDYDHDILNYMRKVSNVMNRYEAKIKEKNRTNFYIEDYYPENGYFYLPWRFILIKNGYALLYHPNHIGEGENGFLYGAGVFLSESLNSIDSCLKDKLTPIYVQSKNGKIVDVLGFVEIREGLDILNEYVEFPNISIEDLIKKVGSDENTNNYIYQRSFGKQDSYYLNFLERLVINNESNKNPIYKIEEHRISESNRHLSYNEDSFLFISTIKNGYINFIYENSNYSRSTYVFVVEYESKNLAINAIISFFSSRIPNKRQKLSFSALRIFKCYGVVDFYKYRHEYRHPWSAAMTELL